MNKQTPMLGQFDLHINHLDPQARKANAFSLFTQPAPVSRFHKFLQWCIELCKQMRMLAAAFDGQYVRERLWHLFQNELSLIIVPALHSSSTN